MIARPTAYPTRALAREKRLARSQYYTAANDFEHCVLMAEIMRSEDKNSRAAQMLEMAAYAVRFAEKKAWLKTRLPARPNAPVRR